VFVSPYLEHCVEKMALNAKVSGGSSGDRMVAVSSGTHIRLWGFTNNELGLVKFDIGKCIDAMCEDFYVIYKI